MSRPLELNHRFRNRGQERAARFSTLAFARTAVGRLDREANQLSLEGGGLFGFEVVKRRGRWFRLAFRLRSGETLPFTYYGYPDEGQATAVAQAINAFLAPGPGPDGPPAG